MYSDLDFYGISMRASTKSKNQFVKLSLCISGNFFNEFSITTKIRTTYNAAFMLSRNKITIILSHRNVEHIHAHKHRHLKESNCKS